MELVVTELEPKERFKCEVCGVDFYKRWNSLNACQKLLDKHLKTQSHKHNVERREQGLAPERVYNLTSASKRLGELVDRLENRIEDLGLNTLKPFHHLHLCLFLKGDNAEFRAPAQPEYGA